MSYGLDFCFQVFFKWCPVYGVQCTFEFELPSGVYTVVFSAEGYFSKSLYDIELGGEDVFLDETTLTPLNITYSISGAIEGTNGALVNICLYDRQTGILITTAQAVSGYAFTMLEAGEYIIEPSAAGFGFERNSYLVTITDSDILLDLTAYEGAIVYLITYHNMDGAYFNNPQYYNRFTPTFTLNDPIKTGYEFLGWYQDEALTLPADTTIEEGSSGNLEFYASWGIKEYTITYVLNGGENHPENPLSFTYFEEVALLPASSEGFLFGGWYDNEGFEGSPVTTIAEGTSSDKVLYARFIPIQVLVLKEDSALTINRAEGPVTTVAEERTAYDPNTPLYLMGVSLQQKVGEIKENFVNLNIVIEKNGKALADTANISTGCEIKLYADDGVTMLDKLIVVLVGDTSGNGVINALDANRISNYLKGTLTLEGAFLLAADVRTDGKINAMDVTRLNQHTSGINPLY